MTLYRQRYPHSHIHHNHPFSRLARSHLHPFVLPYRAPLHMPSHCLRGETLNRKIPVPSTCIYFQGSPLLLPLITTPPYPRLLSQHIVQSPSANTSVSHLATSTTPHQLQHPHSYIHHNYPYPPLVHSHLHLFLLPYRTPLHTPSHCLQGETINRKIPVPSTCIHF